MADWAHELAELIDLDGDYPTREIAAALRKARADGYRAAADIVARDCYSHDDLVNLHAILNTMAERIERGDDTPAGET